MARKPFQPSAKEYKVGYGRPPKQTQWKRGQSGNPSGKKKGLKSHATIVRDIMRQEVTIPDRGQTRTITTQEAIYCVVCARALEGDLKAVDYLLKALAEVQSAEAKRRSMAEFRPITAGMSLEEVANDYHEFLKRESLE